MPRFFQHIEPGDNLGKITKLKYIDDISKYLNVPKEYLLYGDPVIDDTSLLLSDVEDYKKFRQLSDEQQCLIRNAIDIIWRANNGL